MSFDTVEEQKGFADKEGYSFKLLADTDKVAGAAYDAIRAEGEPYAEHGLPRRLMYVIAPDQTVAKAFDFNESRDFDTHSEQAIAAIKELAG